MSNRHQFTVRWWKTARTPTGTVGHQPCSRDPEVVGQVHVQATNCVVSNKETTWAVCLWGTGIDTGTYSTTEGSNRSSHSLTEFHRRQTLFRATSCTFDLVGSDHSGARVELLVAPLDGEAWAKNTSRKPSNVMLASASGVPSWRVLQKCFTYF